MRRDVTILLCAGVDQFLWGVLQGHGIEVVPDAIGSADDVIEQWRSGKLTVPQMWPRQMNDGCGKGLRRRKGRRGGR
jgi:predicted Fe-Mo cluster-binding NifX family protein